MRDRRRLATGVASGLFLLVLLHPRGATAAVIETEPNGVGSAPSVIPLVTGGTVARGSIAPGDVDYFSVDLPDDSVVTVLLYPVGSAQGSDPLVAILAPSEVTPRAIDDDDGPGFVSIFAAFLRPGFIQQGPAR